MTHRGAKFGTSAVEVQVAVPQIPLPLLKQRAPTEVVSERLLQKAGGFVASIGQWGGCTFDGGVDDNIRNAVYDAANCYLITLSSCKMGVFEAPFALLLKKFPSLLLESELEVEVTRASPAS